MVKHVIGNDETVGPIPTAGSVVMYNMRDDTPICLDILCAYGSRRIFLAAGR